MEIINFSSENHIKKIVTDAKNKEKLFVIDCSANWCGPCKAFSGFYHDFVKNHKKTDTVCYCKVDIDNVREFCDYNEINSLPTILFVKNSEVVDKIIGGDRNKFVNTVKKHLR